MRAGPRGGLDVLRAEMIKLRTLPAVWLTVAGTWALAAAAAMASHDHRAAVGYAEVGLLVLGVVAVTADNARTSLLAVPRRGVLTAARTTALTLTGVVVGGVVALGAVAATAQLTLAAVLAGAVGTVARGTLPALAGLLGWFLIGAPLLRAQSDWSSYLPGVAGGARGVVVLLGWTCAAVTAAAIAAVRRDA